MTPASYIGHHLKFYNKPLGENGGFWTINVDTLVTSTVLGILVFGFLWFVVRGATAGVPGRRQAFVELCVDFVNEQVRSIFDKSFAFVAPLALTVFLWVLAMNAMDFLPVDIMAAGFHAIGIDEFRLVPTSDINATFALALSVWFLMIGFAIKAKGIGGFIHELYAAPFGEPKFTKNPSSWILAPLLAIANFSMQMIEYISKPLSHSLRLFGNMYAGEIIFLLLWLWAATGLVGTFFGVLLGWGWAIFHILIVALQAFIFMMLTIVYIALAHEHH
ncbi:MAG TPA: F0F1 ATP synthase subunit A [Verrucomicrobiae bacterium]|nr:F0F1 ATP synthase subunit A [Verrucomicrobiae bacterium]